MCPSRSNNQLQQSCKPENYKSLFLEFLEIKLILLSRIIREALSIIPMLKIKSTVLMLFLFYQGNS